MECLLFGSETEVARSLQLVKQAKEEALLARKLVIHQGRLADQFVAHSTVLVFDVCWRLDSAASVPRPIGGICIYVYICTIIVLLDASSNGCRRWR